MRTKVFVVLLCLWVALLLAGLFFIQGIRGSYYRSLAENNCIRLLPRLGTRGRILDSQHQPLADTHLVYDLLIVPQEMKHKEQLFQELARFLGEDKADIQRAFRNRYRAPFSPVLIKEDLNRETIVQLEERKTALLGAVLQSVPQRFYPYGPVACHLLGYLGRGTGKGGSRLRRYGLEMEEVVGLAGLEAAYEETLRGNVGGTQIEVDAKGYQSRVLGMRLPGKGKDIQLGVDLAAQEITEELLSGYRGAIVLIDPDEGRIIAMASSPGFNPNLFIETDRDLELKQLLKDKNSPLVNRATSGVYPPGSVFKLVVATAGLETGQLNQHGTFSCDGKLKIGNREFKCWSQHGEEDIVRAIAHSCNVFFYHLGLKLGPDTIIQYARYLGLGTSTGIELAYEAKGFIPTPLWKHFRYLSPWFNGDTANLSVGQGYVLVTPLQLARMISVFANGGRLITPWLVQAKADSPIRHGKGRYLALHARTLALVRQGLREAVSDPNGTAHVLADFSLEVAGKTGTAQVAEGKPHGCFVGFCPYQKPQVAFCIFLEHSDGSAQACFLAKELLQRLYQAGLLKK